jgi:2-amino-4-hydroxy-6-hydroxymethyldihydropteridine diphosphokinase
VPADASAMLSGAARPNEGTMPVIVVAIGANLPSRRWGSAHAACRAALPALEAAGVDVIKASRWYRSAPLPTADGPWYVNGVARLETGLAPALLLALLHRIEDDFGRRRGVPNAPRTLDLDLLAHGNRVSVPGEWPTLPHPRLHERAFVLLPLAEVAPRWRHPVSGVGVGALIKALPSGQTCEPLAETDGG